MTPSRHSGGTRVVLRWHKKKGKMRGKVKVKMRIQGRNKVRGKVTRARVL